MLAGLPLLWRASSRAVAVRGAARVLGARHLTCEPVSTEVLKDNLVATPAFEASYLRSVYERNADMVRWSQLFSALDRDGDGQISRDELKQELVNKRSGLATDSVRGMLLVGDMDGDGAISQAEFLQMMRVNAMHAWPLRNCFRTVFVMGGPGAGKRALGRELAKDERFVHVSCGELLRQEIAHGVQHAAEIRTALEQHEPVNLTVMLMAIQSFLGASSRRMAIIDGFPRSVQSWAQYNLVVGPTDLVILLDCPDDELKARGADDRALGQFHLNLEPCMEYFASRRVPVLKLDIANLSDADVLAQVQQVFPFNEAGPVPRG